MKTQNIINHLFLLIIITLVSCTPKNSEVAIQNLPPLPTLPDSTLDLNQDQDLQDIPVTPDSPISDSSSNQNPVDEVIPESDPHDLACSESLCVQKYMPLLYQASENLTESLSFYSPYNYTEDLGWCVPTATQMVLYSEIRTYLGRMSFSENFSYLNELNLLERQNGTLILADLSERNRDEFHTSNSSLGESTVEARLVSDANSFLLNESVSDLNVRSGLHGYYIYRAGFWGGTDWQNGGSAANMVNWRFHNDSYAFNHHITTDLIYNSGYQMNEGTLNLTNATIKEIFLSYKPGMLFGIRQFAVRSQNDYSEIGGHALAVNGIDDDRLLIYDPWGKIYHANLTYDDRLTVNWWNGHVGVVKLDYLSGDRGYIYTNPLLTTLYMFAIQSIGYFGLTEPAEL